MKIEKIWLSKNEAKNIQDNRMKDAELIKGVHKGSSTKDGGVTIEALLKARDMLNAQPVPYEDRGLYFEAEEHYINFCKDAGIEPEDIEEEKQR